MSSIRRQSRMRRLAIKITKSSRIGAECGHPAGDGAGFNHPKTIMSPVRVRYKVRQGAASSGKRKSTKSFGFPTKCQFRCHERLPSGDSSSVRSSTKSFDQTMAGFFTGSRYPTVLQQQKEI